MMRVSTAGLYQALLSNTMRVQSDYASASAQEASGLSGTSFTDYGSSTQRMLNLQSEIDQTQTWSDGATVAGDRAQSMYTAVGNMIDTLTTLRSKISAAISSTDNSSLNATGSDALTDLSSEMNSQLSGRYLFAGGRTDTKPVDLAAYPATSPPSATVADTSYYTGDTAKAAVTVGQGQSITYGVTGDSSAFEKALRVAALVSSVTTSPGTDTTTLTAAYDLAGTALTELANLQEGISNSASRLSTKQTQLSAVVTAAETTLGDVKNVDTAEASLKVTNYKTQLQASYSALAAVMKVKLTDYL